MKKITTLVISALATLPLLAPAVNYENYSGFQVSEVPHLPAKEVHPSLWFNKSQVPEMIARKTADKHSQELWRGIVESPLLQKPLPELPPKDGEKTDIRLYYGEMPQIAALHGLQYQLAEDSETKQKHLKLGKEALLRLFDGYLYEFDPEVKSSPGDEIYHALWMQNAAAAYDWLQEGLTPEEDEKMRGVLKKQAQFMRDGLDEWAERPHNHLSKPAWGLGSLALVLNSEPEAADWLNYSLSRTNKNTRYFFSEDGIYREGSMYYLFSAINFIPFLYHYKNVSGVNQFAQWQPAFEWPLHIRNGKGWMPNIEDSFIRPYFSELVAAPYRGFMSDFSDTHDFASILMWNFENTDYKPFEEIEKITGFNYTGASWDYNLPMTEFLCYDPTIKAAAPDSSPTVFLNSGQTIFRSDWNYNDPKSRYLLFQGVAEADNHEHYEHLSFIIQAENQMMASDAGYTRKSYGEAIRKEWYKTPEAHNVIMVNGEAPEDPSENVTPESRYQIDTDWFDMEEKEAPYSKGGSHKRLIGFLGNTHWVILDRVEVPDESEISSVLHGGRGSLEVDGDLSRWSYEEDIYGPSATLDVYTIAPGTKQETRVGEVTYIKGDFAEYPYTVNTINASQSTMLRVLFPSGSDVGAPEKRIVADASEMTIEFKLSDGSIETILSAVDGMSAHSGDISTDASLAVVRSKDDKVHWISIVEGTSLKVNGTELIENSKGQKMTGTVQLNSNGSVADSQFTTN